MTVHVTMLPAAIPPGLEPSSRVVSYEDEDEVRYRYLLHDSGALIVRRTKHDEETVTEVVYGPSAWEGVQGDGSIQPHM
ncbi:hypothetical protein [Streptomyces lushanensis]|uniref:hypothetical protein n=1 Tax=Streptomyces lushanensis TaxID=1434255 RepID=UPI00083187CD|nr:hypothetical protein [Streptomyces lushanensis]